MADLQDIFIQTDQAWLAKQQVEVFQRFREPETLHLIEVLRDGIHHVADCGVSQGRPGVGGDGFEHLPAAFEIVRVTGDAVHDED